jgi:hypothetical protein
MSPEEKNDTTPISAGGAEVGPDGVVRTPDEVEDERNARLEGGWREQK